MEDLGICHFWVLKINGYQKKHGKVGHVYSKHQFGGSMILRKMEMIWKTVVWCHFMFISYLLMTFYQIFASRCEASIASRGGYFEIELEGIHN